MAKTIRKKAGAPKKSAVKTNTRKKPASKKKAAAKKTATPKKKAAKKTTSKKKAVGTNKLGVKNSLVNNINKRKEKGIARSKKRKTVDTKSYKKMEDNWGKKK
jgi:hypothetical protein